MSKQSISIPDHSDTTNDAYPIFPPDPHGDMPYQERIQEMIEKEVERILHKRYPHLVGVTIYDFMNSNEIYLYRAALIISTFMLIGGWGFSAVEIVVMVALFWISGIIFGLVKNRKASIFLYWIAKGKSWIGWILFLLASAAVLYLTYRVAVWYNDAAQAIQELLDTIWANMQTLQTITERTQNIGQNIQSAADSVGQGVRDGANSAASRVRDLWE